MYRRVLIFVAALGVATIVGAGNAVPPSISAAVADPHRPPEQANQDALRKPGQLMAFAGIKTGDRVADFMPGNAYFTRMFSKLVGPTGRVYAFIPDEQIRNCKPAETAGSRAIARDPVYGNVVQLSGPVNEFTVPHELDVLWTAQNYHDLHDAFLGPADIRAVNKAFLNSLKPGGVLIVIDHSAAPGTGLRDTETLHRIDPGIVRKEVEAAGFLFEAATDDLNNQDDDHARSVFDPLIRGKAPPGERVHTGLRHHEQSSPDGIKSALRESCYSQTS